MNLKTALALTSLALLSLPAAASAQPQIDPDTDSGLPFYATVGEKYTFSFTTSVMDEAVCTDDKYDDNSGDNIDVKGNDYNLAGVVATLQAQPQSGGEWTDVVSKTITKDDIDVGCEDGEGSAYAEVELTARAAEVRTNYRMVYRGGVDNINLTGKSTLMFPRFPEKWQWKTAKNGRSVKVTLSTDPKLIGMKTAFFLNVGNSKTFKLTKRGSIGKKAGKGYLKMTQKLPAKAKKGWHGYLCLNYQVKYPLMNTGNSCPTSSLSSAKLEELFPYSTQGGY